MLKLYTFDQNLYLVLSQGCLIWNIWYLKILHCECSPSSAIYTLRFRERIQYNIFKKLKQNSPDFIFTSIFLSLFEYTIHITYFLNSPIEINCNRNIRTSRWLRNGIISWNQYFLKLFICFHSVASCTILLNFSLIYGIKKVCKISASRRVLFPVGSVIFLKK